MRVFLSILFLIFSLQSWTKADDISDFEIEGISIGDSLLDYVSKEFINKNKNNVYDGQDIYNIVLIKKPSFTVYDSIQVHFEKNDQNFSIRGLDGFIYYINNIEDCYNKQKEIAFDISQELEDEEMLTDNGKHPGDETGKSTYSRTSFFLTERSTGAEIEIICFNNSKEFIFDDKLSVTFYSDEYSDFLHNYYRK